MHNSSGAHMQIFSLGIYRSVIAHLALPHNYHLRNSYYLMDERLMLVTEIHRIILAITPA